LSPNIQFLNSKYSKKRKYHKNPTEDYKKQNKRENWVKYKTTYSDRIRERSMEYRLQKMREETVLQKKLDTAREEVAVLRAEAMNGNQISIMDGLPPDSVVENLQRLVLV
jgi:hypothetical protein